MQLPKVQPVFHFIFGYFDLIVLRAFGEEIVKYLFNLTEHFPSSFLPRHSVEKLNVDWPKDDIAHLRTLSGSQDTRYATWQQGIV